MTNQERINKLSVMINDSSIGESILSVYLDIAHQTILNKVYPYDNSKTTIPAKYETLLLEIACYLINKRGAEGELSHNENGINRTYESSSIPESMLKDIVPFVSVI